MNKLFLILLILFISPLKVNGGESVTQWPSLSQIKCVSGRVATETDINEGAAAFMLQSEGISIGSPMKINIPQYAIHTDVDTGAQTKVIIIQAEEANNQQVIGALNFATNEFMVALFHEFKFLGKTIK